MWASQVQAHLLPAWSWSRGGKGQQGTVLLWELAACVCAARAKVQVLGLREEWGRGDAALQRGHPNGILKKFQNQHHAFFFTVFVLVLAGLPLSGPPEPEPLRREIFLLKKASKKT